MASEEMSRKIQSSDGEHTIFRIPPYFYLHVLDQNTNVTRVEIGPQTYIRADNERVVLAPERMVVVPPRHYCVVENPVEVGADGKVVLDSAGQARLLHADQEFRLAPRDPFPLYPGEVLKKPVTPLQVVMANTALRLRCVLDYVDDNGDNHVAGDEWLFEGPGTYIPRKEVVVDETIRATVTRPNQAIRLVARKETTDRSGNPRWTGEEYLVRKIGAYLPTAYEEVVDVVDAVVLTEKLALHLRAHKTFKDVYGVQRKSGEEWLVTMKEAETHIPDVYEKVLGIVNITTLTNRQYCVVVDPVDASGKPQLGQYKLIKGETSFFLQPGESLRAGIQDLYILGVDEGLILRAKEYTQEDGENHAPGDLWMIRGPCEYIPSVTVEVDARRKAIPLDENEGIYVRDMRTGKVRAIIGETYMLTETEELFAKEMTPAVEALLASARDPLADRSDRSQSGSTRPRDKTRVVSYRVPHNAACQIYDYKLKKSRIVFGPDLVMLGPDEQFTQLSLSGGKPKRANVIKSLCLLLGPDFCTDIIVVDTGDHARLSLQLSYNWHFDVSALADPTKLFAVPDFIGDCCKAIASRVRGAVAGVQFDAFHKNSATIIRSSVFGRDEKNHIRNQFRFPQNGLVITSIDIQGVEPVDQRTRDALQKSVQLAIEITTNAQEATARHEAEKLEQEARGSMERQKIHDEAEAEKSRRELLLLQAESAAVESTGQAKAEAEARAQAARIEGEAAVDQASLKAKAARIDAESEIIRLKDARSAEIEYIRQQNELEISRARELADIEVNKFNSMIQSIGTDTIRDIATAGPAMQAKLLQGLGIRSTLITDGNNPINLFSAANGLLGSLTSASPQVQEPSD